MAPDTARNDINQRLQNALEKLRQDCLRVEIWATALPGFSQPVPEYDPSATICFRRNTTTRTIKKAAKNPTERVRSGSKIAPKKAPFQP